MPWATGIVGAVGGADATEGGGGCKGLGKQCRRFLGVFMCFHVGPFNSRTCECVACGSQVDVMGVFALQVFGLVAMDTLS